MDEAFTLRMTTTPETVNLDGVVWHHRHEIVGGRARILLEQKESKRCLVFWEGPEDLLWPTHLYGVCVDPGTPQFELAVALCRAGLATSYGIDELPPEFT